MLGVGCRDSINGNPSAVPPVLDPLLPPVPDPLLGGVELQGISHWDEQFNPGEINAQLEVRNDAAENDEEHEEDTDDGEVLDNSNPPNEAQVRSKGGDAGW